MINLAKNKSHKIPIIVFGIILILTVISLIYFITNKKQNAPVVSQQKTQEEKKITSVFNHHQYSIDDPTSIWLVVNKQRPIDVNYVPAGLVTPNLQLNNSKTVSENSVRDTIAEPLTALFNSAKASGIDFMLASGYRSSGLQNVYYTNYVAKSGQAAADRYSARPGTSEHQTGLAVDIATVDRHNYLSESFGDDPSGQWLKQNAHNYGFIIRYPENKEDITGYLYEPWHIRYVGLELAKEIYSHQITMEEFFILNN